MDQIPYRGSNTVYFDQFQNHQSVTFGGSVNQSYIPRNKSPSKFDVYQNSYQEIVDENYENFKKQSRNQFFHEQDIGNEERLMNKYKSKYQTCTVPQLSIQSSQVFYNGSMQQNQGDRHLSPNENFEEDDDEGGVAETLRMDKPARMRQNHFERTTNGKFQQQFTPKQSFTFNPFLGKDDNLDTTPRGNAIGKSRILQQKPTVRQFEMPEKKQYYQDPTCGNIYKKMVGHELQYEKDNSTMQSIKMFESPESPQKVQEIQRPKTSATIQQKRNSPIIKPNKYNQHLVNREKVFQQKLESIEAEKQLKLKKECTFKPNLLRPKSQINIGRRSPTSFYEQQMQYERKKEEKIEKQRKSQEKHYKKMREKSKMNVRSQAIIETKEGSYRGSFVQPYVPKEQTTLIIEQKSPRAARKQYSRYKSVRNVRMSELECINMFQNKIVDLSKESSIKPKRRTKKDRQCQKEIDSHNFDHISRISSSKNNSLHSCHRPFSPIINEKSRILSGKRNPKEIFKILHDEHQVMKSKILIKQDQENQKIEQNRKLITNQTKNDEALINKFKIDFEKVFDNQMRLGSEIYILDMMEDLKFLDSDFVEKNFKKLEFLISKYGVNLTVEIEDQDQLNIIKSNFFTLYCSVQNLKMKKEFPQISDQDFKSCLNQVNINKKDELIVLIEQLICLKNLVERPLFSFSDNQVKIMHYTFVKISQQRKHLLFEENKKLTQQRLQKEEKKIYTGKPKINPPRLENKGIETPSILSPKTPKVPKLNFEILATPAPQNEITLWHLKQQKLEQERQTFKFIEQVKPLSQDFTSKANTASETQSDNNHHRMLMQRFDNIMANSDQIYQPRSIQNK